MPPPVVEKTGDGHQGSQGGTCRRGGTVHRQAASWNRYMPLRPLDRFNGPGFTAALTRRFASS